MKNRTIMEMQPEQRPDEKFLAFGPEALTDAELLAIILRTGSKEEASVELAARILRPEQDEPGSILSIFNYDMDDLRQIRGIGKVKALQIKALAELSRRIAMTSAAEKLLFNNPDTIAGYYMEQLRHCDREQIILILLNSACRLIKDTVLSIGTVNTALYSVRDIFQYALKGGAVSLILVHNHPSGDPSPSPNDIEATQKILRAGRLMDIPLLDHIIVGDRTFYSFKLEGMIDEMELY